MRRVLALVLQAVFSFPLVSPALLEDGTTKLPACCRRDGKHHCSMSQTAHGPTHSGANLKSDRMCPLFPKGRAVPAVAKVGSPNPIHILLLPVVSHPAAVEQVNALYRISFSRAWQKRGPPTLS